VAFVHHALHMGGVERQIELTWSAVRASSAAASSSEGGDGNEVKCASRIAAEVLLFQERGAWADRIEELGMRVLLFPIYSPTGHRLPDSDRHIANLVKELQRFDLAHVWYGGGVLGSFSTFASQVAAHAQVPVVQNLAWNVFTVDLSVAVVVVECDQTQDMHRAQLQDKYGVTREDLELLGLREVQQQQGILEEGFLVLPSQEQRFLDRELMQDADDDQAAGQAHQLAGRLDPPVLHQLAQALDRRRRLQQDLQQEGQGAQEQMPVVLRINPGVNTSRFRPPTVLLPPPASPALSPHAALSLHTHTRVGTSDAPLVVGRISR
jgi:hypothetical protein